MRSRYQSPRALEASLALVAVGARPRRLAQALVQIDRRADGSLDSKTLFGVRYVELVSEG